MNETEIKINRTHKRAQLSVSAIRTIVVRIDQSGIQVVCARGNYAALITRLAQINGQLETKKKEFVCFAK